MDFMPTPVLRAVRAVVVEADNLDIHTFVVWQPARMMLKAEVYASTESKRRLFAGEPPDDLAAGAIYLVNGAGIARGQQVMSICGFIDAVDVEVVPCI